MLSQRQMRIWEYFTLFCSVFPWMTRTAKTLHLSLRQKHCGAEVDPGSSEGRTIAFIKDKVTCKQHPRRLAE